ncbi:hypothetical protein [Porphyromonas gingivicanis]|nr:hypothetical protein [Porphyromonas gingivicanis]
MDDNYQIDFSLQAWQRLASIEREVRDERHRMVVDYLKAYARSL